MWFFFSVCSSCTLCLHMICTLVCYYQYISIVKYVFYCFWQIYIGRAKADVLLCRARLWTCFVGFSYSPSGPNIQPQSGVITPCEQKSVTRVPERCLRLPRLPEWLVRVQRLQSFRCDKLSKLSDVQIHLYFRQFLCFPHHFICFKWKCHIKLIPAFWLV